MPSKKKKYNARFPAGRIKKIMQTDEEVGKVAQAVPVIISRTLELFVESLLTKAMEITSAKNAKTLTPSHMKKCILSEQRFDFLKDLVKAVQDSANGEDDVATGSSGLLTPPPPRSVPERRRSGSSMLKEEPIIKEEPTIKQETIIKEEPIIKEETIVKEQQAIKEEVEDPAQLVANCSTLHLRPNFYADTMGEQTASIHQPPVVGGYHPHPYQDPHRSPVLVMDEDYDT